MHDEFLQHRGLVCRSTGPTDVHALTDFFVRNDRPEITRTFNPFPLTAATAALIVQINRKDRYFIAEAARTIVGLAMLRGWDEGYVVPSFGIVIDHARRGTGIGQHLMRFTIDQAVRMDADRVRLTAYASNQRGLALFQRVGFREVSRQDVVVCGEQDEKVTMTLRLDRTTAR
jgi:ribosomal protein S18 acetylase RimI-like enzyme